VGVLTFFLTFSVGVLTFFETELSDGSDYDGRVFTQPSGHGQTCSVANGSGTISGANASNVIVSCSTEDLVFENSFE